MRKILIILFILSQISIAKAYVECVETPASNAALANLVNFSPPEIVINEISFKDKTADFIELYVKDDKNSGLGANIKDFAIFVDGSEIKKISADTILKTGEFILITFKSSSPDDTTTSNNLLKLYTSNSGLVSTTSAIALKKPDGALADAVCWDDLSPTDTQKSKIDELINSGAWTGQCVLSTNIKDNESIGRNITADDTNQAVDWNIFAHPTAGAQNQIKNSTPTAKITIQQGSTSGQIPLSINVSAEESFDQDGDALSYLWDFGDNTTSTSINPLSHSYTTAGTYIITLTVTDALNAQNSATLQINALSGNSDTGTQQTNSNSNTQNQTSAKIVINEFMPDPEGTDTGFEWIELKNLENTQISLAGYSIDDSEGGSSPYIFPEIILMPQETKAFYSSTTKIVLNNDTDHVRLFDPNGKLIDEIMYEKPVSGKSFARDSNGKWSITSIPTPNAENSFQQNENTTITCNQISQNNSSAGKITNGDSKIKTGKEIQEDSNEYIDSISFTEILPNPKGTDTGKEWIELYNESDKKINLGNWQIQNKDGKRKYLFKDKTFIAGNSYLVISPKTALKNTGDIIRLLDPENNIIDEIEYGKALEGMSFAEITTKTYASDGNIDFESKWEWTTEITKNAPNPSYEVFNAKIVDADLQKNQFKALNNNKKVSVSFSENILPQTLAANILKADENFRIKARQISDGTYELQQIDAFPKIENAAAQNEDQQIKKIDIYPVVLTALSIIATAAVIIYIKKARLIKT